MSGPVTVTFSRAGLTVPWDTGAHSLLEFAEAQGLEPAFSCRAGVCSTCMTRLTEGEITYFEEPLDDPDDGHILICCSRPVHSVVLDL